MTWPDTMSDPGGHVGTSRSYMMYMVRGNRGGAETDGRAEDPFEAAARGASASVPWKFFFYLTLSLPHSPNLSVSRGPSYASTATQSGPEEAGERPQSFPWRHSPTPSKSSYCRGIKNFPQPVEISPQRTRDRLVIREDLIHVRVSLLRAK